MSRVRMTMPDITAARQAQRPSLATPDRTDAAPASRQSLSAAGALLDLQRSHGNHHVQQVIQASRRGQARAAIGQPGDRYEREADRVAREVVRAGSIGAAAPRRDGAIPDHVRAPVERALGADFSQVRLHTGDRADRLNRDLSASAFTTGRDIYFRRGAYDPQHPAGQETLAHELAHVVQQQTAGAPVIQCKNKVTSTDTDHQKQPISVLHDAFAADFITAAVKPEVYTIYSKEYNPAKIDPLFKDGVTDWGKPNRPKHIEAELDGPGPSGKRKSSPPQSLYGYLGTVERAMYGRQNRTAAYEGGHFISDEILGKDSYSEFNFAPQDAHLNAPLWRNFEEMALDGPVSEKTGKRAPSWKYRIDVSYPGDYVLQAENLAKTGVIPKAVADLNPNKLVTFPRRIPYLWKGKLEAPAGHVFPQQVLNPSTQSHKYYTSPAGHIDTHALTRQGSWELNVGMDSLEEQTSPAGLEKVIGGKQIEQFTATQSYPDTIKEQPEATAVQLGKIPVTPLVPVPKPPKLKNPVNLRKAAEKAASEGRKEIVKYYPTAGAGVWKLIQEAALKLGHSGIPTAHQVLMEAAKAKKASKSQVKVMKEMTKDTNIVFS
jgi:hypothetical protein